MTSGGCANRSRNVSKCRVHQTLRVTPAMEAGIADCAARVTFVRMEATQHSDVPPTLTRHDKIYTMLLGLLTFLFVVSFAAITSLPPRRDLPEESSDGMKIASRTIACYS